MNGLLRPYNAPVAPDASNPDPYQPSFALSAAAAKRINNIRCTPGAPVWQRNYYERIVRSEEELNRIRQYIIDNPTKWDDDPNNPTNWTQRTRVRRRTRRLV